MQQYDSDKPPEVPAWFTGEVVSLFALYPNAHLSQMTVPAWWRVLHALPREAVVEGFRRAPDPQSPYAPNAMVVRGHALAAMRSGYGSERANLDRKALPEPEASLPDDHPMFTELEGIKQRMRAGELRGQDVMREVMRVVVDKL
jgi:hypothetical protein